MHSAETETEYQKNEQIALLSVMPISLSDAKRITVAHHYMKTWPHGACQAFGVFMGGRCYGCMVLGYAPTTEAKVKKYCRKIERNQYIELQRTWISDKLGQNTESWMMSRVMRYLRDAGVWVVLTHSGGCKDDVGFIFQASGWLYFGCEPCSDFFLTADGKYKNIIAAMRFGRVPKDVMKAGNQAIGEYLFGKGEIVHARRHLYLYPIKKGIRKRLSKIAQAPPKDPAIFRRNQQWVARDTEGCARGAIGNDYGSHHTPPPLSS